MYSSPTVLSPSCFFFTQPSTTAIYTLSLHDALPICLVEAPGDNRKVYGFGLVDWCNGWFDGRIGPQDRKSTRLNSSHLGISYAVFCLKKKNVQRHNPEWKSVQIRRWRCTSPASDVG